MTIDQQQVEVENRNILKQWERWKSENSELSIVILKLPTEKESNIEDVGSCEKKMKWKYTCE